MFLVALYYYYRVGINDWRRYFIFYLILGILYVIITISSVYLVFRLITNRKKKKKRVQRSEVEERFFLEIEGMINWYLKKNEGETYTAKVLINNLENYLKENTMKEYFRNNIEEILFRMNQRGTIQLIQEKEGIKYSL